MTRKESFTGVGSTMLEAYDRAANAVASLLLIDKDMYYPQKLAIALPKEVSVESTAQGLEWTVTVEGWLK